MSDDPADPAHGSSTDPGPGLDPTIWDPDAEPLDDGECLRLISPGGVGRLAYSGRVGLAVLPVSYKLDEGSIVFRTAVSRRQPVQRK
jgi:hypothetical protein